MCHIHDTSSLQFDLCALKEIYFFHSYKCSSSLTIMNFKLNGKRSLCMCLLIWPKRHLWKHSEKTRAKKRSPKYNQSKIIVKACVLILTMGYGNGVPEGRHEKVQGRRRCYLLHLPEPWSRPSLFAHPNTKSNLKPAPCSVWSGVTWGLPLSILINITAFTRVTHTAV